MAKLISDVSFVTRFAVLYVDKEKFGEELQWLGGEAELGDSETGEGVFDRKRRGAGGIEGGRRARRRRRRILFVQIVLHAEKPSVFRLRAPCWQNLHPQEGVCTDP